MHGMNYKKNDQMSTEQSALIYFIWVARPNSIRCKTQDSLFHFVVSLGPDKQKTLFALSDCGFKTVDLLPRIGRGVRKMGPLPANGFKSGGLPATG